ncbi:uncharacterized protein EV154DRAFT_419711, partial [Mucor mucedo]|uniref:uncharacterized protein n=1 Tax=Mucor mucedo TaxID=29922 RepID=UPI00221E463A
LQRNYTLIRQLDETAEEIMQQVAVETAYLSNATDMDIETRRQKLERIGQLLNESLKKGEEKFALAKSTYDTVDRHCTRLDNDLQKIEDEQLIGPGRVNQQQQQQQQQHQQQKPSKIINHTLKESEPTMDTSRRKRVKKDHQQQEDTEYSTQDATQYAKTAVPSSDLPIDPNEPVYCYCQQVSFGEMIACENEQCDVEWFHLECAGLKTPPKGAWYCNTCANELKKKKK